MDGPSFDHFVECWNSSDCLADVSLRLVLSPGRILATVFVMRQFGIRLKAMPVPTARQSAKLGVVEGIFMRRHTELFVRTWQESVSVADFCFRFEGRDDFGVMTMRRARRKYRDLRRLGVMLKSLPRGVGTVAEERRVDTAVAYRWAFGVAV